MSVILGKEHSEATITQAVDTWFAWRVRGPHVMIVDMRQGYAGSTAKQRAHMAQRVRELLKSTDPDETKHQQLALILVSDNALVRGLITGVLWLVPTKMVPRSVSSMEEAVELAVTELSKAGVSVPREVATRAREPLSALR
ncbi:MAG TPA: hypothetical protein VFZ61_13225 [Polyangiales bacterium]